MWPVLLGRARLEVSNGNKTEEASAATKLDTTPVAEPPNFGSTKIKLLEKINHAILKLKHVF